MFKRIARQGITFQFILNFVTNFFGPLGAGIWMVGSGSQPVDEDRMDYFLDDLGAEPVIEGK